MQTDYCDIHNISVNVYIPELGSWNWYEIFLRFAKFRGSKIPSYNPLVILKSLILYSFSLYEFSMMVSHIRFLTRQYKYKCGYMPYWFLLIFFPLGFKGVFDGILL